jgi:alpha-glucosidase
MIKLIETPGQTALLYKDRTVFTHCKEQPFAEALVFKAKYKASRGHYKIRTRTEQTVPLNGISIEEYSPDRVIMVFFGGDKRLSLTLTDTDGYLKGIFKGYQGGIKLRFYGKDVLGVFGGGEQFRQLDLKGEKVVNFVSEHITLFPILQKTFFRFIPYKEKSFAGIQTYAPMSTFVFAREEGASALRMDTDAYGEQNFAGEYYDFTYRACPRGFLFAEEGSYSEVSETLARHLPVRAYLPDWAYDGIILGLEGGTDAAVSKVQEMMDQGVKVCGVWCQDWCGRKVTVAGKQVLWNWQADDAMYHNLKEKITELKEKGIHFLAYINPYLVENGSIYLECKEKGYLIRRKDGSVYPIRSTTFRAGMLDLTNPAACTYLKETLIKRNMLDLGIDGYMADFGEYLPVDCVLHSGNPERLHNEWPVIWARLNREAIESHPRKKDIFFFTRSAYNAAQSYTTMMWNGDQHTDFSKDFGLPCVIPASFNLGFSGVAAVHSDIGGYITFKNLKRDKELLVRWMEMNVFSPLMRGHESVRPEANAQLYDAEVVAHTARLSALHAALKPYIRDCMQKALRGIPVMRPDFYDSGDYRKHRDLYSYLFGSEIYVCPVIEKGAFERKVFLPDGEWMRFFDGTRYDGGGTCTVDAPLGKPVAFYRKNSVYKELFDSLSFSL